MPVIAVLLLVVVVTAVHALRVSGAGSRWPFAAAAVLAGGAVVLLATATVVAAIAGRDRWNGWVSGTGSSETLTLWVVLVVGPGVLVACAALMVVGVVLRGRQRRVPGRAAPR